MAMVDDDALSTAAAVGTAPVSNTAKAGREGTVCIIIS